MVDPLAALEAEAERRRGRAGALGADRLPPMALKIAVLSQKGGTGKTTAVRT